MDGDFAYALRPSGIGAYAVAELVYRHGALWRRKTLGFAEEKGGWSIYNPSEMKPYLAPILAGDHICAVMRNNLVVFEALQDTRLRSISNARLEDKMNSSENLAADSPRVAGSDRRD